MDIEWLEDIEEITLGSDDELTPDEQVQLENWTAQNCATTEEF